MFLQGELHLMTVLFPRDIRRLASQLVLTGVRFNIVLMEGALAMMRASVTPKANGEKTPEPPKPVAPAFQRQQAENAVELITACVS
jgi:hypothetical protein